MADDDIALFALDGARPFGERMARALNLGLAEHEERDFEDGEHKTRPLESVRGRDAFVVQLFFADERQSVNDRLCRLLFFIGALRDAAARSVTAVVPYLCYARKDRKTKTRDPVTTRYVAELFEAVGTDRVVTMDVHNLQAFQNSFRCATEHLEARPLFVRHFARALEGEEVAVVSPDIGGAKRAAAFAEALGRAMGRDVALAFVEKHRSAGVVSGEAFAGEVEGRSAVIIDDLIASGGTMLRAARACRARGAKAAYAAATHGLFTGEADAAMADPLLERVVVTDTLPPRLGPEVVERKLVVLDAAAVFAEAVRRIRDGGSITELNAV